MNDRTGELWRDGDATFLVTGPASEVLGMWEHPVIILASDRGAFDILSSDVWTENKNPSWAWERIFRRLA